MNELQHPEMMRQELIRLIAKRAFVRDRLSSSSVRKGGAFVDTKYVTLHPRGAAIVARIVLARLRELKLQSVGGMSVGGIPIVSAIVAMSDGVDWPVTGFFIRKPSEHVEHAKTIEGNLEPGTAVAFVDDIISGGRSTLSALRMIESAGCTITKVFVVVDRDEGGPENLRREGYDVEILIRFSEIEAAIEE